MRKVKVFVALLICALLMVPVSFAKDTWEMAQSDVYKEKAGGMLGRGFINAATSPVDIFVQTVNRSKDGPPLVGTLTGMAAGLGCTALRASSGIVDVGLFWVPGFNGFPVSRSYDNCLEEPAAQPAPAPVALQPVAPVAPEAAAPVVTVSEPAPVPVTKHVVKKHNAYDYVKK
jgi:hypothetical protein